MYQQNGAHKIGAYPHHQVSIGGEAKTKAQVYMKEHPLPTDPTSILDGIVRFFMFVSVVIIAACAIVLAVDVPKYLKIEADAANWTLGNQSGNPQCEKNLYADFHPIGFTTIPWLTPAQANELRTATAVNAPIGPECDTCPSGEEPIYINVFHMCSLPITGQQRGIKNLCLNTSKMTPTGGVAMPWNQVKEVSSAVLICVSHAEKDGLVNNGYGVDPDMLESRLSKYHTMLEDQNAPTIASSNVQHFIGYGDGNKKPVGRPVSAFFTKSRCLSSGSTHAAMSSVQCCSGVRAAAPGITASTPVDLESKVDSCMADQNMLIAAGSPTTVVCATCYASAHHFYTTRAVSS